MDSDNDTYKMLTVLNGGGASTCTVTGLMKYQLYEFFIVPFYKTVEGKPSNSHMARTLEDGKSNYSIFVVFFCSFFACVWKSIGNLCVKKSYVLLFRNGYETNGKHPVSVGI